MAMTDVLHNEFAPDSVEARDLRSLFHPMTNLKTLHEQGPQFRARAKGVYIWDGEGKKYLEAMAGLWCTALGYGVEELAEVAKAQLSKLSYSQLFTGLTNEPSVALAEKILSMVPIEDGRVFFGLSGSDANDTQIKLMWHYHNLIGKPEKKKIISRIGGYHGVTVGAGSLTGLPQFHKNYDLPIRGILHTESPNYYRFCLDGETEEEFAIRRAQELENLIQAEGPETIAAFIAEPVLGAGGVIVPSIKYYEEIQRVLREYEIFFIDDEVICGFGRTGMPFGCQTMQIEPTTMSLAKALSSAYLPISAVVVPNEIYEPIREDTEKTGQFNHGFTYSGHPVCAAVAVKNLELMEERDLFSEVREKSDFFQKELRSLSEYPIVGDVRGVGLIGAIELVKDRSTKEPFDTSLKIGLDLMNRCHELGLIVRAIGDSVCLCPPLVISHAEIEELFHKLRKGLDATQAHATTLDSA